MKTSCSLMSFCTLAETVFDSAGSAETQKKPSGLNVLKWVKTHWTFCLSSGRKLLATNAVNFFIVHSPDIINESLRSIRRERDRDEQMFIWDASWYAGSTPSSS